MGWWGGRQILGTLTKLSKIFGSNKYFRGEKKKIDQGKEEAWWQAGRGTFNRVAALRKWHWSQDLKEVRVIGCVTVRAFQADRTTHVEIWGRSRSCVFKHGHGWCGWGGKGKWQDQSLGFLLSDVDWPDLSHILKVLSGYCAKTVRDLGRRLQG